MSIKSQLYVVILSVVIAGNFLATSESTAAGKGHGNIHNMVYLGAVEGKSYFAENTYRNWTEALKFCNASGMRLATITSAVQATFLQNAYNSATFQYDHWVAGRDALDLSRFSWDHNEEKIDGALLELDRPPAPTTCLTYYSYPSNGSHFHAYPCDTNYKTLCEINPA